MRTSFLVIVLVVGTLLFSGCIVQSLHPFFTKDAVTKMSGLVGTWKRLPLGDEQEPKHPWLFGEETISTRDDKGGAGDLNVTYFKVGESTFVDATAGDTEPGGPSKWWSMHTAPVHTLSKVVLEKDRLEMRRLDYKWLEKAAKSKQVTLPYVEYENSGDRLLFTATSDQWMDFLGKHGENDKAFPAGDAVKFTRLVEAGAKR